MAAKPKLFLNWSSGKDAAYALYLLQEEGYYEVDRLLTTINSSTNRISLHGLSKEILAHTVHTKILHTALSSWSSLYLFI